MTIRSFAPPFFNQFSLTLNRKTLKLPIYHTLVQKISIGANTRRSRSDLFCKERALKNCTKYTGKHLCQSLFCNDVAGLSHENLLKNRLWNRCFFVNFAKFLKTASASEMQTLQKRRERNRLHSYKSGSAGKASRHPAFMGNFATISITC